MVVKRRSHWCKAIDVRLTVGMCRALGSESFLKRPVRGKVEIHQVSCSQLISRICWVSEYADQGHDIGHHGFEVSMGNHLPSRQMMLDLESMGDWEVKKSRSQEVKKIRTPRFGLNWDTACRWWVYQHCLYGWLQQSIYGIYPGSLNLGLQARRTRYWHSPILTPAVIVSNEQ